MRKSALVAALFLAMSVVGPNWAEARAVHGFGCGNCHKSEVSFFELGGNNVCITCHQSGQGTTSVLTGAAWEPKTPTGYFVGTDASNAMNSYPGTLTPVAQTSHMWAVPTDVKPAAGAVAPTEYAAQFNGQYNVSRGKLTCTRCHDPHGDYGTNPKLLKVPVANDEMCRDCHLPWDQSANSGYGTHPMVADYEARAAALNTAAAQAGKEPRFKTSVTALAGEMRFVNGGVSCTTCHGVHFTDSDSSTLDGKGRALSAGDGKLLRADGPTRADKSALCQSCHVYKRHGNPAKAQINVGCLVCHSGHSFNDDGPNPNYFVLRRDKVNPKTSAQVLDQDYTALGTLLNDKTDLTQTGFCERCHGEARNIPNHAIDRWTKDCRDCHGHNVAGADFSWKNDASVAVCGDCHGFPPYVDLRGDVNNGGTAGGYAYTDATHNYDVAGYKKNEATTPHNSHAAGGLNQGTSPATDYLFGAGQGACDPCHFGLTKHREDELAATYNATTFRDVYFSPLARAGTLLTPAYNTAGNGSCSVVYCHSNGGRRNASGTKVAGDFTFPATAPIWGTGDYTIIGTAGNCYACHGNNATTMSSTGGNRNNSASHLKHVAKYACNVCHVQTATSATALVAGARIAPNGKHVNGTPDIAFDTAYNLGGGLLRQGTTPYTGSTAVCAVYCHSNGGSTYAALAYAAPDWDAVGSVVCGTCHGTRVGDATVIGSASHAKHVSNANGPTLACNECHVNAGSYTVAGGHADHINGAVNIDTARCTACHGYELGEKLPVWGETPTNDQYCLTCHTGASQGLVEGRGAPNKETAKTRGHNATANYASGNVPASRLCTDCHSSSFANHLNGTADTSGLNATGSSCLNCHGSPGTAYTTKKGIVTHVGKNCTACHDPHGDAAQANIYMVRSVSSGNYASDVTPVVFTNRGNDAAPLTATNSFDEDDDGSAATHVEINADDLCATCHTVAGGTTHNNRDNSAVGHHMGENCFTSCHKTHAEPAGAFISGGGDNCGACHGNPPATGAHRTDRGDRSLEETAAELHSSTASDYTDEPRDDCGFCHPGAEQYTYSWSADQASLIPGRMNHNGGNRVTNLQNNLNVQYTQSGNYWYCAAACHVSSATDGYWFDKSAGSGPETWNKDADLNCNACHYYEVTIASNANNAAAGVRSLTLRHDSHFNKQKTCSACHTVLADTTHISIPGSGTDIQKIQNRAQAVQDEATVLPATLGTGSDLDPGNPTCAGAGVGLGCHNTKTTPAWNVAAAFITCTNCHDPAGSATADPKTGLHNMNQANVQKHDSTITGGCTACHNSTKPATHADGTWQADQASNTESRFLNRTYLVYNDAGGPNMGTCFDNGASGAGSLDFAVSCHRDNGVWKRLWSTEADSTATTPGSSRCKACHGQYENLNTNQGGGWNEGTSHYLTLGGRSSVRGESHNSRNLGDASACEDCHSFDSLANHENGSITMNDAAVADDTDVNDTTSWVFCEACHVTGDPLLSGTFTFTKSTLAIQRVSGSYDPIQQCNSCHGVGGGGRYWPVAPNGDANTRNHAGRHEIHMDRLAKKVYNETVAQLLTDNSAQNPGVASDTKQKELCSYCHNSPGFNGHALESLPAEVNLYNLWNKAADAGATYSSNQHGAVGNDTCAGVNCHNNKLTVDNSYGWYDSTTGAGCVVCHTVGGTNDLPNNNIHPNSGLHNITPTVSGMQHDDSFSISGTCASCHTGIVTTIVGGTHINGTASADGPANTNAERGLFAAYSEAAVNSSTCAGSGVDNTANCHADGGTWNRRWSTTASVNDGATECANCHGTFLAGWRWSDPPPAGTTDHIDPSALNVGDAMGVALKHPDCQICHGWGKPGYDTAWHNKTVGVTPGHGDGRITMNGPDDVPGPGAGAKYDESTGGCAAACHSATWVMSDSGLTVNYGDYGGGSCSGCHGDGGSQYWPDGTSANPPYADNNANSAARHNTHIQAISQYKWGLDLTGLKSAGDSDAKQKAVCAFCHGVNPGASGHNSDSGDSRVDVAGAGAFRMFTGSANDALDSGSGAYALATRSCSNLVCHNLVTTPTAAADAWEGTTAANCTTLCHAPNTVTTAREAHQEHVVTRAYACTQCHANNGTNYGHINGIVNMVFDNPGSLEAAPVVGLGDATYTKGSFAYSRTTPNGTCANVYCHVNKPTPAWNGNIDTSTTGCVDCHTAGGAGTNPTSGLHDEVPRITGKQHSSGFTFNGGASTAYCSTCHTTTPSTNHVDGTFTTSWNAVAPSINFAAGVGFTDGTPPTCGATTSGCHKDAGAWKRKWHEDSPDATGLECAGCHGDWLSTWNTGVTHRTDNGPTSNHPAGTSYKCKDCHAFESTAYGSLTWGGNHGNSQITMNTNATSFARGTGGDAGLSGCATTCHVAFDGTADGQHSFTSTTTRWATVQSISGDVIDAGCNGCHGNTSVGVGQYWPDGTVNKAQYAYADDNTTAAANHTAHITAVAQKRYGEVLDANATNGLLRDNTTANPTLKSSDKQKAICAYCHPNPGAGGHTTDAAPTSRVDVNRSDTNGDGTPDTAGNFVKIVDAVPGGSFDEALDTNGFFRAASTDRSCSNVACHASAPFTPGWYGDTVAPGAITDLEVQANTEPGTVKLLWNAPGDDNGDDGTANRYDVRYRPTANGNISDPNWNDVNTKQAGNPPTVGRKHTGLPKNQSMIVKGLTPGISYTFAVKTYDEAGNVSTTISNVPPSFAAQADNVVPVFSGVNTATVGDAGDILIDWDAARDHSHSLTTPILYKAWYGNYSLKAHLANSGTLPAVAKTCYDKDTTPPTVVTCDTSAEDYHIMYGTTTALRYQATGLKYGNVYYAMARARDPVGNEEINTNEVMVLAKDAAKLPTNLGTYKANGANSLWSGDYANPIVAYTWATSTEYKFYVNTAYSVDTNVSGVTFEVYIADSNKNTGLQFQYQLGYGNGTTFTPLPGTTGTMTVGKASKRVRKIPLNGFSGMVPSGQRLCVRLYNNGSASLIIDYGDTTNKGLLLVNEQQYNHKPTTSNATVNTSVSGPPTPGVVNITWTAYTDSDSGQTVHYDLYGSTNSGTNYNYLIATGVCFDGTTYDPDCTPASGDETTTGIKWDTIGDGITGNLVNVVRVRVAAGDGYKQDDNSLLPHVTADSSAFSVDNTSDGWPPAAVTTLTAETRPKQGSVYLSWKAVGNDGLNHGTRANLYDIRYSTSNIPDSATFDVLPAQNQAVGEPSPTFSGDMESFELLGLNPEQTYYIAMKVGDAAGNWSGISNVATTEAGPKCGICHATPPNETATAGKHANHGYTMRECGYCHTTAAETFATDHQDGVISLGFKTATPATATTGAQSITYNQDPDGGGPLPAVKIYEDTNGVGGFNASASGTLVDNGTCFGFSSLGVSGCHGPATPSWDTSTPALACSACHGTSGRTLDKYNRQYDATLANGGTVPDQIKASPADDNRGLSTGRYVGAHEKHLNSSFRLSKGDNCRLCHKDNVHYDGLGTVTYDLAVTGAGAQWDADGDGGVHNPNGGGTCAGTSEVNCHGSNTPEWHSAATVACNQCHGFNGANPTHIKDGGVDRACTWCHPAGHPQGTTQEPNSLMIPNNVTVGISYRSGGIHLLKVINGRSILNDATAINGEAEICWGCHEDQAPAISEWGTNTKANTGNMAYNYGTLTKTKWNSAVWNSANQTLFAYKNGAIRSTHTANPAGSSTVTGSAFSYTEAPDDDDLIRCSWCHDVHNMNKAEGDTVTGTPYLRGTWKGNPYKEDGAPHSSTTYTAVNVYGAVPRAGTGYVQDGGFWIDQNSGSPTSGWTLGDSAGLCTLCHGSDVDIMDQKTGENLWLGTNGHSNSAIGGTFTNAANIFGDGVRNRPAPVGTTGALALSTHVPNMGYQSMADVGASTRAYGYRGLEPGQNYVPDAGSKAYSFNQFNWGVTLADGGNPDIMYHSFSCSKCHNPHASRLPKLMITNCLDVKHNTWDDNKTSQTKWTASALNNVDKLSTGGATGMKTAYYASAQNCHRYTRPEASYTPPDPGGWNKVTPW